MNLDKNFTIIILTLGQAYVNLGIFFKINLQDSDLTLTFRDNVTGHTLVCKGRGERCFGCAISLACCSHVCSRFARVLLTFCSRVCSRFARVFARMGCLLR